MAAEQPKKVTGGAFGRFLSEQRPILAAECKGKPATAVVQLASARFKGLSSSEKAKYETQYAQAKLTYEKDLAAFLSGGGEVKSLKRKGTDKDDKKQAKKLKKLNKDPNAPKQPAGGGYACYLNKNRQAFIKECPGQAVTAVSKLAGSRWAALSADAKKPFLDEFVAKQVAYKKAIETYVPPAREEGEEEVLSPKDAKKAAKVEAKAEAVKAKEDKKSEKEQAKAAKGGKSAAVKSVAAKGGKKTAPPAFELQPAVLAKAEKANLKDVLVKLATRDDIKASGKTELQMLKALEDNSGLLHAAKRALLGC